MKYVLRLALLAVVFAGCEREPLGYEYRDQYSLSIWQGGDGGVYFLPPLIRSSFGSEFDAARQPVVVVCAGAPATPCTTPVAVLDMTLDAGEDASEVVALSQEAEAYRVNWKAAGEAQGQYRIFVTEAGEALAFIDVALLRGRSSSGGNARGVRVYGADLTREFSGTLAIAFRMEVREAEPEPAGGLKAEYFDWRGMAPDFAVALPLLERIDPAIDFADSTGSTDVFQVGQADSVMARWTGSISPDADGFYTFCVTGDDGLRFWINDIPFTNSWTEKGEIVSSCGSYPMNAGSQHSIRIEWYHTTGSTAARLTWQTPDDEGPIVIPSSVLSPM